MASNQTEATGIFKSQGSLLQQEGTVLSTKTIRFAQEPLEQYRTVTKSTTSTTTGGWFDPLAQSFLVEETGGCFITKIDIYFQQKDASLPVSVQIREVVNGYPGSLILPYSDVTLRADEIETSEDSSVATSFEMVAPVYVQENTEYCFVVYSDSFEYNAWIAELGLTDILTEGLVSKQPYAGVLFKSQNASTWSANQQQDIKFVLYKAQFDIDSGAGIVRLDNDVLDGVLMSGTPFETTDDSSVVKVTQKNHGFNNASQVTLLGFDETSTYNGIPGAEFNGTFNVSAVEVDSYKCTLILTTPGDVTAGLTGRQNDDHTYIYATKDVQLDVLRPNISSLVLPSTSIGWTTKTVTGRSIADEYLGSHVHTAYTIDSEFWGVDVSENNQMPNPKVVASKDNYSGNKSLLLRGSMLSDNRNISPIVDLNRAAAIAVGNRIDEDLFDYGPRTTLTSITSAAGDADVVCNLAAHGLSEGSYIQLDGESTGGVFGTVIKDEYITGTFEVKTVLTDTFVITSNTPASLVSDITLGTATGGGSFIENISHEDFIGEIHPSEGSLAAKYVSSKIALEEISVGFRILFTASIQNNSTVDIYYKAQGPYDESSFSSLEYKKLGDPDTFVSVSKSETDFKEHEYTVNFDEEDYFINIAFKLVMKSTDSTRVPIFQDFRVICLGS